MPPTAVGMSFPPPSVLESDDEVPCVLPTASSRVHATAPMAARTMRSTVRHLDMTSAVHAAFRPLRTFTAVLVRAHGNVFVGPQTIMCREAFGARGCALH